jgi:hypothetical protein
VPIDGLAIDGVPIGSPIANDCRSPIGNRLSNRQPNQRSSIGIPINDHQSAFQSTIINRHSNQQSTIGIPINNQQSAVQSTIFTPPIFNLQSAVCNE